MLEFIRRSILLMEGENLKLFFKEVEDKTEGLNKDHPAYIEAKINDQLLLNHVNKNGIVTNSPMKLN